MYTSTTPRYYWQAAGALTLTINHDLPNFNQLVCGHSLPVAQISQNSSHNFELPCLLADTSGGGNKHKEQCSFYSQKVDSAYALLAAL